MTFTYVHMVRVWTPPRPHESSGVGFCMIFGKIIEFKISKTPRYPGEGVQWKIYKFEKPLGPRGMGVEIIVGVSKQILHMVFIKLWE